MVSERPEYHTCHFCGEYVSDGLDPKGERHWLSDCRPDLVKHEPGPICTWHNSPSKKDPLNTEPDCYAYQIPGTREWGTEHTHFYEDGPM